MYYTKLKDKSIKMIWWWILNGSSSSIYQNKNWFSKKSNLMSRKPYYYPVA